LFVIFISKYHHHQGTLAKSVIKRKKKQFEKKSNLRSLLKSDQKHLKNRIKDDKYNDGDNMSIMTGSIYTNNNDSDNNDNKYDDNNTYDDNNDDNSYKDNNDNNDDDNNICVNDDTNNANNDDNDVGIFIILVFVLVRIAQFLEKCTVLIRPFG
jgi:hypothetical protein